MLSCGFRKNSDQPNSLVTVEVQCLHTNIKYGAPCILLTKKFTSEVENKKISSPYRKGLVRGLKSNDELSKNGVVTFHCFLCDFIDNCVR